MKMKDTHKEITVHSDFSKSMFILFLTLICLSAALFLAPDTAEAWPGKQTNCMQCHNLEDSDGAVYTSVDGIDKTPVTAGDPITVNVNAGDSFELDWYVTNTTDSGNYDGIGITITYPDGWTVTAGTSNSPSLSGWSSTWDNAAGLGALSPAFDTHAYHPGSDGKTINFDGSSWDIGSRDAACDKGGSCSTGTDLDGMAETMGGDAMVTVPSGATSGMYTIIVFSVGHDSEQSSDRAHMDQVINVNVTGTPGTDDTLSVTLNTPVATSASDGQAEIQMQRLQVDCDNIGDGNCIMTSITIDDLGLAKGFDSLDVHVDDDTDYGNGTLGYVRTSSFKGDVMGLSLTTLSEAVRTVTNGTSKYLWIIYDIKTGSSGDTIEARVTAVNIASPDTGATGIWDSNQITVGVAGNVPPSLNVDEPDGTGDSVNVGDSYTIQYDLSDADNAVTAAFYYDSDDQGYDGTAISGACSAAAEGANATCAWDTTGVTPGSYYIYGAVSDGINPTVKDYSVAQITISAVNASPTLTVDEPNGTSDTVTVGDLYNIQYDLSDSDDTVTAAFYYDLDNAGYDGTAISGACAAAAEGTNATCSWDTTGMPPGSYYVYGITNDGTNTDVKAYSAGQITINPAPVSSGPNSPSTSVSDGSNGGAQSWVSPDNVTAQDNSYTYRNNIQSETSEYLKATNLGFSIPASSVINGIVVEIDRYAADASAISDTEVKIVKGGAVGSENKAAGGFWPTSDTNSYQSYGGSSDLWGETWTAADINSANFGVVLSASAGGTKTTMYVDHIRITVNYLPVNTAPDNPGNLAQYRSDGITVISSGEYTEESTVKIEADISDATDGSDTVKLQVDLDGDNISDCQSSLVSNPSANVQVSCTVGDGVSYDWQARTVDNGGLASSWVAFAGTPDFIGDQTAPAYTWNSPSAGAWYKDADTISVDATVTDSGAGITNGAACNAKIDGATSSFTGSVTYATGTGKCTGTLTLGDPSGLTNGVHNLTVEVADDLGNTQQSGNRAIGIDNSAPTGLGNASPADAATDQLTSVSVAASTASDSGSGSVQYYFEVAEDSGFSTGLQQSGWQAGASFTSTLANSTVYYWHVKARDALGNETSYTSTWSFTTMAPNNAPTAPADHAQYRSDGTTSLTNGWTTNETTVVIKATVSDPDSHDTKLEVEIIDNAGSYTGTPNCSSGYVTSGTVATATCSGLSSGTSYKWRARTNDSMDTSAWQTWGGVDPDVTIKTAMDFGVATTGNTAPDDPANLAQYRSNGVTVIASGGYTEEATVKIEADISDPDGGDTVKLQVDMDGNGSSDCESALGANPGTNVQVSCTVTDGVSYDWQVRTVDDTGSASSWVAFAGSPDLISDRTAPAYTWNTPADGTYYKDGQGINVDVTITETGSGMTDGADCFVNLGVADTGYTGTVNYDQATGKCTGTLTLDNPSGIADGAHNITLNAEDNIGNSQTSAARSINIDNSAPTGLSNSSPANTATDQSTSVSVTANTATDSGSGSVQYFFEVAEESGFSVGLQQSGWQAGTSYAPILANSTTYYWHVNVKDAIGNETSYTSTWSFTTSIPNTLPDNPVSLFQYRSDGTTVIAQGGYTDETSIIIKASVDDTDAQNVSIEAEIALNGGSFTGTANCTGGSSVAVPGTAQVSCSSISSPNSYKWRVRAYDGIDYSNWVTYGGNPDVTVDQIAPSYTWNLPTVPSNYADGDTISVDVTVTESGVGITNGADCTPLIDGAATEFTGSVTYDDGTGKCTGTLTIDIPSALTEGSHNLTVEVADIFGNTQQSANRSINIDNTAPSYTWNTPAAGTYYTDGDSISVDVSITETGEGITNGVSCNPKIDGAATEFTGAVTYNAISQKCTGTLTIDDPSALTDGSHNLTVEVADDLGNTQQSVNRSINIDNTAPAGLSNSSPADSATDVLVTSSVAANTATDSGSGSVQYFFEVAEDSGFSTGLQQSGWQAGTSYAPTLAGSTTYYWHVAASDALGNTTTYTTTWSFITEAAANNPPNNPSGHEQYEADGTTAIAQNGINDSSIVKIKATVTDEDGDTVRLDIEMIDNASSYTGTPNCYSQYVASGSTATASCGGLVDGVSYKWRVRTNDGTDVSSWQTHGPSDPDVRIILSGQFNLTSCSGCHAYPPTDGSARNVPEGAVLGGHAVTEHDAVGGNCNKCHAVPGAEEHDHRDGNIDMTATIHGQTGSSYSKGTSFAQSNSPSLGTCSATYCHGTQSFQWNTPQLGSYDSCTICHGNATSGSDGSATAYKRAPGADGTGVDTNGDTANTDAQVGAHQAHLTAPDGISDPIACGECHIVPSAVGDAGHWDTSGARDAADLTFNGPIGDTDGQDNPLTITYSSGQCLNTYCHDGTNLKNGWSTAAQIDYESPTWNSPMISSPDGDGNICDNCHGYPPAGSHDPGTDCSSCHDHVDATDDGFTGATNIAKHINHTVEAQSDCTGCHNGVPGGSTYVTRAVVSSDFALSSRHVFGGTVTNWDCIVCHSEGDATDASSGTVTVTAFHGNGGTPVVDMRNVDSINTGWVWDKNNVTNAMHTNMDSFCMACHDSDGASGINVKATDDGVNLSNARAMTPFNSTDDVSEGVGGGTANVAGYERTAVLDVFTQFDPTNPSHHAVRGQAYTGHNANWGATAWVNRSLKSGQSLMTVYEAAQLHCADCHTTDQNAHGGSNGFMLQASSIDGTCYLCHNSATYSNNSSTDTRWDHSNDGGVWDTVDGSKLGQYGVHEGSICRNCHGGNPVTDGFGGIHGLPSGTDARSGEQRYRFIGGSYMSHSPASWTGTSGGTPTCYFDAGSKNQAWSNCTQHSATEDSRTTVPQYSRGVPGDY